MRYLASAARKSVKCEQTVNRSLSRAGLGVQRPGAGPREASTIWYRFASICRIVHRNPMPAIRRARGRTKRDPRSSLRTAATTDTLSGSLSHRTRRSSLDVTHVSPAACPPKSLSRWRPCDGAPLPRGFFWLFAFGELVSNKPCVILAASWWVSGEGQCRDETR